MSSYTRKLGDVTDDDLPRVGRKTLGLAQLRRAGFPVPDGVCVTTAAFSLVQEALRGEVEGPAAAGARMAALPLLQTVVDEVAGVYERLFAGAAVAVRSSAVLEDLPAASFAGQYETFLNVTGRRALEERLRGCWASVWSPRVLAYCARNGIAHHRVQMAVLIQEMIPADVSGVLFTLNPLTGVDSEMLLEAVWGLGEGLVSGRVHPDQFLLDARSRQPLATTVGHKRTKIVPQPGGTREVTVSPEDQSRPCLDEEQCRELAGTGRRIQVLYGAPQDIEFAYHRGELHLLQTRPITSFSFASDFGEWTTADFRDGGVSAGVCSPFMWSLYDYIWRHTLPDYLKGLKLLRGEINREEWGRVFFGRPYWNLGAVKRCLLNIPGFVERNFDTDLSIRITYEGNGATTPVTSWRVVKAIPTLLALQRTYRRQLAFDRRYVKEFEKIEDAYDRLPIGELSLPELAPHYKRLIASTYFCTESNYFLTIFNQSNSKLDFKSSLDELNAAGHDISYLNLIAGIPRLRTLMPLYDMWRLAARVAGDPGLKESLLATPAEAAVQGLRSAVPHGSVWALLKEYVQRYRYHGRSELDITVPRWDEDAEFVFDTFKSILREHDATQDPEVLHQRQHERYLSERKKAEGAFGQSLLSRLWPFSRRRFLKRLELVREYTWWREEMRDRSARMYYLVRRFTMEVARRWVAEGVIDREGDVFFLTFPQVFQVLDGKISPAQARQTILENKDYNASFRDFRNPNEIGSRWKIDPSNGRTRPGDALRGIGCSPGTARGPLRVIRSISETHRLRKGDVLVTRFTDPGWTPVLNLVSAVVTETGGLLSHAAIIAREYGIPAVLNVSEATELLTDGQTIEVDGDRGLVHLS